MLLLPKPFPDETIGSIISRGVWRTGLPLKTLLKYLVGPTRSNTSFLMGTSFAKLAPAVGLEAEELMRLHTVLPYALAFMSGSARADLVEKALNPQSHEECSSLTKTVTHGVPFRRLCRRCVAEEMATFGESYWHRQHLLPGVLVCLVHKEMLATTDIPLRGHAQARNWMLPHWVPAKPIQTAIDTSTLVRVAELSCQALRGQSASDNLLGEYRSRAVGLGYKLASGQIASIAFSSAVQAFYGQDFLVDSGCQMSARQWPSLMLRPNTSLPFATAKHVLLQAFLALDGGAPIGIESVYKKPGKTVTDFNELDSELTLRMKTVLKSAQTKKCRMTVKELLTEAGSWQTYRHHRADLPLSEALVLQFRASEQAQRQIGGREYWRNRLPGRFSKH